MRDNQEEAIRIGRKFAFRLLNGYGKGLREMVTDQAASRIAGTVFAPTSLEDMSKGLKGKKLLFSLDQPLSLYAHKEMQLIALRQIDRDFVVMTISYKVSGEPVEIPGVGKLIFAVATRYRESQETGVLGRLMRKLQICQLFASYSIGMEQPGGGWYLTTSIPAQ